MAKVNVINQIVIDRPLEQVAQYAAHPESAPYWYRNIKSVEWKTSGELALGTRVDFVTQFLGKRFNYTYEVYDYVPGKHLFMKTNHKPFQMETRYTWVATHSNGTKMTLQNLGNPQGFASIAYPLVRMMINRQNKRDLKKLKSILESP